MSDLQKIFGVVQSTYGAFQESVGKTGEEIREGRTIRYKSMGYMYRWQLHFKVEAFDMLTGITAEVNDYVNPDNAIVAAVDKVMEKIVQARSITDPSTDCAQVLNPPVITKELNSANLQCTVMRIPPTLAKTSALGTALQVPEHKIIEFMTNHPRDIGYVRTEILRYWLDNDPQCSWESLAGALLAIGEKQLAEEIRAYRVPS